MLPIASISIVIASINHLYLIPDMNNIINVINKYINTTPVSGCRNVSMLGMSTTINIFNMNMNSCAHDGLRYSVLNLFIILASVIINIIFTNSLGWNVPIPGIVNQHFALLTGVPNINSSASKTIPIIYSIHMFFIKKLFFIFITIIINTSPIAYQMACFIIRSFSFISCCALPIVNMLIALKSNNIINSHLSILKFFSFIVTPHYL